MSGSNSQALGVVSVVMGGQTRYPDTGAKYTHGGLISKGQMVGANFIYSNTYAKSAFTGSFPFLTGKSLETIKGYFPGEFQVTCDTGQTYVMDSAILEGELTFTSGTGAAGGKFSLSVSGPPASEVLS